MDAELFQSILSSLILILVILLIVIKARVRSSFKKQNESIISDDIYSYARLGMEGEEEVDRELNLLNKEDYIVLKDLTLLYDNSTHQIDHVVVSNYGIFVIETKNYSGFIKGSDKYYKWVQFIGKKKYMFLNPVFQNKGHISALQDLLPEYKDYFVSIVCFTNKSKLKVNTKGIVINLDELLHIISNFRNEILILDINEVAQNLKNLSLTNMNGIEQDHLNNIKKYEK